MGVIRARRARRRVAAAVGLVVLLAAGPAGAAPPSRSTLEQFAVSCGSLVADDGGSANLFVDRELGDYASVTYWEPGASPDDDPPALVSTGATVTFDGRAVQGAVQLVDPVTEEPAGEATFALDLERIGEPVVTRSGASGAGPVNHNIRILTTRQDAAVTGVLALPNGSRAPLEGCVGSLVERVIASNNPSKFVERPAPQSGASCLLTRPDGHSLSLNVFEFDGLVAELSLLAPGGEEELAFGFGEVTLDHDSLTALVPLYDQEGGQVGEATITATLGQGAPRRDRGSVDDVRYNVFVREQPMTGAVQVSGIGDFSLDGCAYLFQRGWLQYPNPEASGSPQTPG